MYPQKRFAYMQKIFRTEFGLTPDENIKDDDDIAMAAMEDRYLKMAMDSLKKVIDNKETPPKEKHIRKLIIASYHVRHFRTHFRSAVCQLLERLKAEQISCWKFCYVWHKLRREGYYCNADDNIMKWLLDLGNLWRHLKVGYGQMIHKYCVLLRNRDKSLWLPCDTPKGLKLSENDYAEYGETSRVDDEHYIFEQSCKMMDVLEDIINLQKVIFASVEEKKLNSITPAGQCHLTPIIACIQDSSLLYDCIVKILFKLHSVLPTETLQGHRDRFLAQHKELKNFYIAVSNLQYFKTLIQVPCLTDRPPNFLVASDLTEHVRPQLVIISGPERDSPDQTSSTTCDKSLPLVDFSDIPYAQIPRGYTKINDEYEAEILRIGEPAALDAVAGKAELMEQVKQLGSDACIQQEEISRLKRKLRWDRRTFEKDSDRLSRQLTELEKKQYDMRNEYEAQVKKLKDELSNYRCSASVMKNSFDKLQEECERAKHENEISQEALKKLVKDLSDLKVENANLRLKAVETPVEDTNIANASLVTELSKKVEELTVKLDERDNQSQKWVKEREELISAQSKLARQLDNHQGDLLMSEMNETDKIIKEATKRIEELSEKSRNYDSGIKLQVNEKISEVCFNLMKAVRNLIIQSRLLQREIVGDDERSNCDEFYKRNSTWTEGLISAANVVAMAARSLVDSADRAMSGQAKYSELAAAAHEIGAATTQLVVASRVKAKQDSDKLKILTSAAKQVNQCTSNVVDTARVCAELIEQEVDKVDISSLSLHQTKKLEMETQVKLLELEDQLSKERIKLGLLRRQHYEQEEAQLAGNKS